MNYFTNVILEKSVDVISKYCIALPHESFIIRVKRRKGMYVQCRDALRTLLIILTLE